MQLIDRNFLEPMVFRSSSVGDVFAFRFAGILKAVNQLLSIQFF